MSLVKCKECGHEISKSAKQCPNCGSKIKRTSVLTILVGIIFAFAVFLTVGNNSSNSNYQSTSNNANKGRAKLSIWNKQESLNKFNDTNDIQIWVKSSTGQEMTIVCRNNKTELYLDWKEFISTSNVDVTHRVGTKQQATKKWSVSTNFKSTFHSTGTISFIKSMIGEMLVIFEVTPHGENPRLAEFLISGLGDAIKPIRESCSW